MSDPILIQLFGEITPSEYCKKETISPFIFIKQQFFVLSVRHYPVLIIAKMCYPRLSCPALLGEVPDELNVETWIER